MLKALNASAAVVLIAALVGCAGKQYVPPPEGASDVATASFKSASRMNSSLQVMQFDKKGCYQGNTDVPREGATPLRLAAGDERFFMLSATSNSDSCKSVVSFTPEADARYRLVELKEFPHGILGVRMCGVRVEREAGDGKFVGVNSQHWRMQQVSFKCFRAAPAGDSSPSTLRITRPAEEALPKTIEKR